MILVRCPEISGGGVMQSSTALVTFLLLKETESLKERRSGEPSAASCPRCSSSPCPAGWCGAALVGPAVLCWSREASVGSGLRQSIPVICHSISENIKCLC